ncbi:MAG: response regulator [Opitutaceae bacterium]|nr:response regulator [Opitutaceae bacterium]
MRSIREFIELTPADRQQPWSVDLECDVLHFDPVWRLMWIRDHAQGAFVDLGPNPPPLRAGLRVRVRGLLHPPNERLSFADVAVDVLGEAALRPVPLVDWQELNPALLNQLVVAEGVVDRQTRSIDDATHLRLFLSIEGRPVVAWVYDPAMTDPPDFSGALVRVTGIYNPRLESAAPKSLELMVPGMSRVEVIGHLDVDPRFDRPAVPIESLRSAPQGQVVRIIGEVHGQQAGRVLTVRDGTGQVDVLSAQTTALAARGRVEAIGHPRADGATLQLTRAVYRPMAAAVGEAATSPTRERRLAAEVLELAPDAAARSLPARITGVVTWSHPDYPYIYVQDNTGGLRVQRGDDPGKVRPPGRQVEVRGVTLMGTFAPEVRAATIVKLGESVVPEARPVSLEHALSGVEESQWVMMRAYVRAIERRLNELGLEEQVLRLATAAGDFDAIVPTQEDLAGLLHAVVALRGVCTARTDVAGKLAGIELRVPEAAHIQVEEPAPVDVFAIPARSLESLGRFGTTQAFNRRVRVEGTVVYAGVGRFILHEGGVSVVALTRESELPEPGRRVEAVGLLGRQGARVVLRETVHRDIGFDSGLVPTELGEFDPGDPARDGQLVRLTGTVLDSAYVGPALVLTVQRGTAVFSASLVGTGRDVLKGSEVQLTGVYEAQFDEYGQSRGFSLLMRRGGDLVVVRPPSPFTMHRVLALMGLLALGTAGVVGWGVMLRRRVGQQTAQIREQLEREAHLQRELERAQRLESLGLLAGGIAHDFNNLLTVVMGNISLARGDGGLQAETRETLGEAELAIVRARDLTQQLLTFSKGGAPVRAAVDLAGVVREVAEFVLHGSAVRPEFRFAAGLWVADVDKGQVGQVVQNIVINAAQAMPGGGRIEIELANDSVPAGAMPGLEGGRYLRLVIRDQGRGISAADLPRIFDPYFTTKAQGSGLGLATVYSIVKRHGGDITVESEIGRGTSFRVWLPAAGDAVAAPSIRAPDAPAPARAPQAPDSAAVAPGLTRVLLMDDDEAIRRVAQAILRRAGYDVTSVGDGAEAVREYAAARAAGRGYAVVIFDLTVPGGMGGVQALQHVRRDDPAVRAIVSSGYSNDPSLADHRELGFAAMVAKPYEVATLLGTVQAVLDGGSG